MYFLSRPVEYGRNTVIYEIAQFISSNISYDNDNTEHDVAINGNFDKKMSCKCSLYCR